MINVKLRVSVFYAINGPRRPVDDTSPQTIKNEIEDYRRRGINPCFQVFIEGPGLGLTLGTPNCPGGYGGRAPNREEQAFIDEWNRVGLNNNGYESIAAAKYVKFVIDRLS